MIITRALATISNVVVIVIGILVTSSFSLSFVIFFFVFVFLLHMMTAATGITPAAMICAIAIVM